MLILNSSGPTHVSIVIATYNCLPLLRKSLAGLQRQWYPPDRCELVIADDGSSDGIHAYLSTTALLWPLKFTTHPHTCFRLATSRNAGIHAASHDVIIQLDGDIIPSSQLVAAHVRTLEADPNCCSIGLREYVDTADVSAELIVSDFAAVERAPRVASASNWHSSVDRRGPEFAGMSAHPAPYNVFHGCNVAYRKHHAIAAGLYDEDFNGAWGYEDTEFAYRLWRNGVRMHVTLDALGFHQENAVTSFEQRVEGDQRNFELACRKIPGFREFKQALITNRRRPWWP